MVRFKKQAVLHSSFSFTYLCPLSPTLPLNRLCASFPRFTSVRELTQGLLTSTDDMVLVQMGSVHEGTTPAEKDAYVAGLKQIIQEMRGRKVKDFNTVASEITSYRRRFLGDPSRFLTL